MKRRRTIARLTILNGLNMRNSVNTGLMFVLDTLLFMRHKDIYVL